MTTAPLTDSRLANLAARAVADAWVDLDSRFRIVTRRAGIRFKERNWKGMAADASERLDLYTTASSNGSRRVAATLSARLHDRRMWTAMKAVYSGLIAQRQDWELAETFFNSVSRKIFTTVGVDHDIEFVDTDFDEPPTVSRSPVYRTYLRTTTNADLVTTIIQEAMPGIDFVDLSADANKVAGRLSEHLRKIGALQVVDRAEIAEPVFFRSKGAYLVGRLYSGSHVLPLSLALLNREKGVYVDAVTLTENELSILFSFTRSYFHVDVNRPHDLVTFLRSIMPRKRVAELYIAIGHHKHGKTELYRNLLRHLDTSSDCFEIAPGQAGMVMSVFTLPGYDIVFKVIKDHFPAPKSVTKDEVRAKYHLVFRTDRAGRLVDAQEFEHLDFPRQRFSDRLLDMLTDECAGNVQIDEERVTLRHVYVERRMIPLDIYVRDADLHSSLKAVLDYGYAIKDLAASGIFPGDMLLKNFGVTRHGRVVFYDYDELTRLVDCNFRELPIATSIEEEMAAEPWFSVGKNDIFPQEFDNFLGLSGDLRDAFYERHADIFTVEYWRRVKDRVEAGELIEIYPYAPESRL